MDFGCSRRSHVADSRSALRRHQICLDAQSQPQPHPYVMGRGREHSDRALHFGNAKLESGDVIGQGFEIACTYVGACLAVCRSPTRVPIVDGPPRISCIIVRSLFFFFAFLLRDGDMPLPTSRMRVAPPRALSAHELVGPRVGLLARGPVIPYHEETRSP